MLQLYHMALVQTIRKFADEIASRATPNLLQYLLFFLIALIPFSVRHVFDSTWNLQTGAYSDFTSLSIYLSDIALVSLLALFILFRTKWSVPRTWKFLAIAAGGWLILELLVQDKAFTSLQAYFSLRVAFLLIFASIVSCIDVSREKLAWLFTGLGGIQAIIATIQFYTQKSIGLYLLVESHLSPETLGVAKIVSHGTKMIRGYGTFPHANLLAAFLVITTLLNLYLLIKTYQIPRDANISRETFTWKTLSLWVLLMFNTFGMFISFSRGGILALGVGIALFIGYLLLNKGKFKIFHVVIPLILAIGLSIGILAPYLSTRTTVSDNAVKERLFYNEIGERIVHDQPGLGVGLGTSVLHMKQYSDTELEPWEVQPIHNFYIISWAEWGIGAILFLTLILYPIIALFKRNIDPWNMVLLAIGISFLVLFLFDHYFYTIWPTQLLLWLFVGLQLKSLFHMKQALPNSQQ